MENNMENKDKVYTAQIEPLVNELLSICNDNGIPFFMVFGTSINDEGKFNLKAQSLIPEEFHYREKDRRFSDFVNVMNGFETVLKEPDNLIIEDDYGNLKEGYEDFPMTYGQYLEGEE